MQLFKQKVVQRVVDYHKVFNTDEGKKVLEDICKFCKLNQSSMAANANDVFFNEGMRNVALRILTVLQLDPIKMIQSFEKQNIEEDSDE